MSAVFLDRDGTLIEDSHYPNDPSKVVLLSGVIQGLKTIQEKGYHTFVISNQSGVARGRILQEQFIQVHQRLYEILSDAGLTIDQYFYCLHHPDDGCHCRKPGTALIPKNFRGRSIDWRSSYFVGDKECDVEAARRIGCTGVLVLTGYGSQTWNDLPQDQRSTIQCFSNLLEFSRQLPDRRNLQR